MIKILSAIAAALAAISFAAVVFAEDVPHSEHEGAAPRAEMKTEEARPMVKHHESIKHLKKIRHRKQLKREGPH